MNDFTNASMLRGSMLVKMDDAMLVECGVASRMQRTAILDAIEQLVALQNVALATPPSPLPASSSATPIGPAPYSERELRTFSCLVIVCGEYRLTPDVS